MAGVVDKKSVDADRSFVDEAPKKTTTTLAKLLTTKKSSKSSTLPAIASRTDSAGASTFRYTDKHGRAVTTKNKHSGYENVALNHNKYGSSAIRFVKNQNKDKSSFKYSNTLNYCKTANSYGSGQGGGGIETAIRLVNQAVHQDSAKNYAEAARCYREAVVLLKDSSLNYHKQSRVRKGLEEKIGLYETRLKKLDKYLLTKADFSGLFKDCVQFGLNDDLEVSSNSSRSKIIQANPFLKNALHSVEKAKKADSELRFVEAIHLYENGASELLDAVRRGRVSQGHTDAVRVKCLLIHERCELIRDHLDHGAPLPLRKVTLDSFEKSLEEEVEKRNNKATTSEDVDEGKEEEDLFEMNEIRSMTSSMRSYYPGNLFNEDDQDRILLRSGSVDDLGGGNRCGSALSRSSGEYELNHPTMKDISKSRSSYRRRVSAGSRSSASKIPLADLSSDLDISNLSLGYSKDQLNESENILNSSHEDSQSMKDQGSRSLDNLLQDQMERSGQFMKISYDNSSSGSDGDGDNDLMNISERDRTLSEITYVNSRILERSYSGRSAESPQNQHQTIEEILLARRRSSASKSTPGENEKNEAEGQRIKRDSGDAGSDSGFSDPASPEGTIKHMDQSISRSETPGSATQALIVEHAQIQQTTMADVVLVEHHPQPSPRRLTPSPQSSPKSSNSEDETNTNPPTRDSSFRRGGSYRNSKRRILKEEEIESVTVLSEETVENGRTVNKTLHFADEVRKSPSPLPAFDSDETERLLTDLPLPNLGIMNQPYHEDPEVYTRTRSDARPQYIPPRAFATRERRLNAQRQRGSQDDVNKGCYYFMACLDSFWIL